MQPGAKNPIRAALAAAMQGELTRKGSSFFRRTEETVVVIHLQKSQWGPQCYLNFGVWLRALGDATFPQVHECHVSLRADHLVASPERLARLLDMEADLDADERQSDLTAILRQELLPLARSCETLAGVADLYRANRFTKGGVRLAAHAILAVA